MPSRRCASPSSALPSFRSTRSPRRPWRERSRTWTGSAANRATKRRDVPRQVGAASWRAGRRRRNSRRAPRAVRRHERGAHRAVQPGGVLLLPSDLDGPGDCDAVLRVPAHHRPSHGVGESAACRDRCAARRRVVEVARDCRRVLGIGDAGGNGRRARVAAWRRHSSSGWTPSCARCPACPRGSISSCSSLERSSSTRCCSSSPRSPQRSIRFVSCRVLPIAATLRREVVS